jgi:hypothetical protein
MTGNANNNRMNNNRMNNNINNTNNINNNINGSIGKRSTSSGGFKNIYTHKIPLNNNTTQYQLHSHHNSSPNLRIAHNITNPTKLSNHYTSNYISGLPHTSSKSSFIR